MVENKGVRSGGPVRPPQKLPTGAGQEHSSSSKRIEKDVTAPMVWEQAGAPTCIGEEASSGELEQKRETEIKRFGIMYLE